MPIIARFKGIVIRMFYKDHPPPHIHATNNEKNGLFDIDTLEMFKGDLVAKDQKEVKNWAFDKQELLKEMWETQEISKID
ncbi:MAG: DUF4160 domain-containing protein [Bacteroidota bacterium]